MSIVTTFGGFITYIAVYPELYVSKALLLLYLLLIIIILLPIRLLSIYIYLSKVLNYILYSTSEI